MRRLLLVAALVVLVALAGCQALDGGHPPGDPDEDRIGWENGYWYDDSISVTPEDGLNESERQAVVNRSMARIEHVRDIEFNDTVPVQVINRSTYRDRSGGDHSEALESFDNAKFEAMFLVGEDSGSIEEQDENRGETVAGYYSPGEDAIVIVSNSETPTLSSERTLAHELVHAAQDQKFGLNGSDARTRDAYAGRSGLIEGDASYTEELYMERCGDEWECISVNGSDGAGGSGADINVGLYILQYFPYSEGPNFVEAIHDRGGWGAVNDAYDEIPSSATAIIQPDRYPGFEPANVSVGSPDGDWEQIEPPDRPNYGVLGQSGITAGVGHTLYDEYNQGGAVVNPMDFLNRNESGQLDVRQPFNYGIAPADGWAGGKFVAYENDAGEMGYVWRTEWDDEEEAAEFRDYWRDLIVHWGGERVGENTRVISDGPYADAFSLSLDGTTVTVRNAPEQGDLADFAGV